MKVGEKIDYLGGYTVYGSFENVGVAPRLTGIVPLGIAVGATVTKEIKKGQPVHFSEVALNESQTVYPPAQTAGQNGC